MRFGIYVDGWDDELRPLAIRGACARVLRFAGAAGYLGGCDEDAEDVEVLMEDILAGAIPTIGRAPSILALNQVRLNISRFN